MAWIPIPLYVGSVSVPDDGEVLIHLIRNSHIQYLLSSLYTIALCHYHSQVVTE
jgi:hypothetical protein